MTLHCTYCAAAIKVRGHLGADVVVCRSCSVADVAVTELAIADIRAAAVDAAAVDLDVRWAIVERDRADLRRVFRAIAAELDVDVDLIEHSYGGNW